MRTFGDFIKGIRIEKGLSLRSFCRLADFDASNWSKIERGVLPPPREDEKLRKIAEILGICIGSPQWQQLLDNAHIDAGIIPTDLLKDEDVMKILPVFFRTLRNEKPSQEELEKLIEKIRMGI